MWHLLVVLSFLVGVNGFMITNSTMSHFSVVKKVHKNVGQPLFITPLLEQGKIRKAQQLSTVTLPNFKNLKSFSGYFTVNKTCESNLFFWFFPAQKDWRNAPVVLWLQGGPGASSLYGLFEELGPILFDKKLKKRRYSWNVKNNLLFIDQPVGTGFSFTQKDCYVTNEDEVSRDLYSALMQFYQLFPLLRKNKFYIAGESYGGHFVPSIGHAIHENNPSAKYKINLRGLLIGNGLMDYVYQMEYSSYLYQLGLVDHHQRDFLKALEKKVEEQHNKSDSTITVHNHFNYLREFIGNISVYNFLKYSEDLSAGEPLSDFVTSPKVRKMLHVGNEAFDKLNYKVHTILANNDLLQSVKTKVEELLEHYPVVFYNGQLDIICAYPMAVNFFRHLQWSGAEDYLEAERNKWCVHNELAGYLKSAHNLHEVLVRAAGHMVPKDQPLWAFELINSVTSSPAHDPLRQLRICGNNNK